MTLWLVLLAAVTAAAGSLILSALRLGSPPMPTSAAVRAALLWLLQEHAGAGRIVDLGSGWGGLARQAALAFPERRVMGLEASFLPWLFSMVLARLRGPANLSFRRLNFLRRPPPRAEAYLCYLAPRVMRELAGKVLPGLPPQSLLISAVFALRGRRAEQVRLASDLYRSPVYLYRCDAPPAGR